MIDYQGVSAIIEAVLKEDDENAGRFSSTGANAREAFALLCQQRLAIDACKRDILTAIAIFLVCPTLAVVAYLLPYEWAWFRTGTLASTAILMFVACVVLLVGMSRWRKFEMRLLANR